MYKRTGLARKLSWLGVASLMAVALLAPAASNAASVTPTHPTGNPTCADLGYSLSFKINTGSLENKTYTAGTGSVETNWDGQAITISGLSSDGQTFDFSSTQPVSAVLVKAGVDNNNLYTYSPPVTSDTDLTHGTAQQGISHLLFCGDASTPTPTPPTPTPPTPTPPTPTPPTPTPPTPTPPTPTPPTPTPPTPGQFSFPTISIQPCTEIGGQGAIVVSGFAATNGGELVLNPGPDEIVITENGTFDLEPGTYTAIIRLDGETVDGPIDVVVGDCPDDLPAGSESPSPTGGVLEATGTPAGTLPATDTIDEGSSVTGSGWRLALMAMAGLLAAVLFLMPAPAVVRGKDRR